MTYTLHHGDCRDVMATMEAESIDAIVCDPPYGLSFMGKEWDHGVPGVAFWTEALRVLKPGGHLLAFGGTRTYHRLAVAIEDAGFEIRDCLQWLYGSGFPKSLDVSKAIDKQAGAVREVVRTKITAHSTAGKGLSNEIDERPWLTKARELGYHEHAGNIPATDAARQWHGWGTALKPSWEPIVMARKPLCGTVADNVRAWGTGVLNIDGCRIGNGGQLKWSHPRNMGFSGGYYADEYTATQSNAGRWPANTLLDEDAAAMVDAQSGGASRFFYVAKASPAERDAGLDAWHENVEAKDSVPAGGMQGRHDGSLDGQVVHRQNHHPTVKPIELMRYLVRLVTPPNGTVLDPFMGSGSTGCGAVLEGFDFVGIDITPEYVEIAERRIAYWGRQLQLPSFVELPV